MYEDTILPVRTKFRVPSRSQTRISIVQEHTKNSLYFLKWTELVICLLCLCLAIATVNAIKFTHLNQGTLITLNSLSVFFVLAEITYPYFKRTLPLLWQLLNAGINVTVFGVTTLLITQIKNDHALIKVLMYSNGLASVVFLVDLMCKIIISTYLYQKIRVNAVVDAAVSAFFPAPSPPTGRAKYHRTYVAATPITYGGTFPIGKNQPPFLPVERNPPAEGCNTPERGTRHKSIQTPLYGDCRAVSSASCEFGPSSVERLIARNQIVQTQGEFQEKGTSTTVPFYLEEERRKKSPWTCSSVTTCKKMEARKQASMSTPITYSGTFAVNKDLVPMTPHSIQSTTPKSSPRLKKPNTRSRSEGNSPTRQESFFLDVRRLDQISEEKLSSENCSLKLSCAYLPGSVLDESDYGSSLI